MEHRHVCQPTRLSPHGLLRRHIRLLESSHSFKHQHRFIHLAASHSAIRSNKAGQLRHRGLGLSSRRFHEPKATSHMRLDKYENLHIACASFRGRLCDRKHVARVCDGLRWFAMRFFFQPRQPGRRGKNRRLGCIVARMQMKLMPSHCRQWGVMSYVSWFK